MSHNLTISPLDEVGGSRTQSVNVSFNEVVKAVGFQDNVTHKDDGDKVPASFGFKDQNGRKGFLWLYKYYGFDKETQGDSRLSWSADGDKSLLEELFPGRVE